MAIRRRRAAYDPSITMPQKLPRRTNYKISNGIQLPIKKNSATFQSTKTVRGILHSADNICRTLGSMNKPSATLHAAGNIEIKPTIVKESSRSTSNDNLLVRDNDQKVALKNGGSEFSICGRPNNLGKAKLMQLTSNEHGIEYGLLSKPLVGSNEEHVEAFNGRAERKNIDNESDSFGPKISMPPSKDFSNDDDVNEVVKQKRLHLKKFDYWYNWCSKTKENIPGMRADQMAMKKLEEEGILIERHKSIGPIPGVEIGDSFNLRLQLAIMGIHTQNTNGIDYLSTTKGQVLLATSIVTTEGYYDVFVNSDELIYTGEGSTFERNNKFPKDQMLQGGNLALWKSMKTGTYVRVIRGFKIKGEKNMKNYVYDGLYKVVDSYKERAQHGRMQWKFRLFRCSGQKKH